MRDLGFRFELNGSSELWRSNYELDYAVVDAGPFSGGIIKPPRREINIFGTIDNYTASKFIRQLRAIQEYDNKVLEENERLAEDQRVGLDPIRININSPGGSIYHGLAMMDCLDECVAKVHTHVQGACMSMAVHIFLEGDVRTAGKHARFMIHGAGGFESGYLKEMESSVREMRRIVEILDAQFYELTKIDKKFLQEAETCYQFLDYVEAWEYGLLTHDLYDMFENNDDTPKEDPEPAKPETVNTESVDANDIQLLTRDEIMKKVTKKDLQYICENLGLKVSGKKEELVDRVLGSAMLAIRVSDGSILVYNKQ